MQPDSSWHRIHVSICHWRSTGICFIPGKDMCQQDQHRFTVQHHQHCLRHLSTVSTQWQLLSLQCNSRWLCLRMPIQFQRYSVSVGYSTVQVTHMLERWWVYENLKSVVSVCGYVSGACHETSSTTYACTCVHGWQGAHCETQMDLCKNISCLNRGVCRSSLLNYSCQCLGINYSGRHCEVTGNAIIVHQVVSRSFAYIAIIALVSAALWIVVMDVMKYCFGIYPVGNKDTNKQTEGKHRDAVVVIRFVYVNGPTQPWPVWTFLKGLTRWFRPVPNWFVFGKDQRQSESQRILESSLSIIIERVRKLV